MIQKNLFFWPERAIPCDPNWGAASWLEADRRCGDADLARVGAGPVSLRGLHHVVIGAAQREPGIEEGRGGNAGDGGDQAVGAAGAAGAEDLVAGGERRRRGRPVEVHLGEEDDELAVYGGAQAGRGRERG